MTQEAAVQAALEAAIQPAVQSLVPPVMRPALPATHSPAPNEIIPLLIGSTIEEIERELVLQTLARCDGNRTRAARVLGMSVRTVRNKIRLYTSEGIEVSPSKGAPTYAASRRS